jgi:hypothetical protein
MAQQSHNKYVAEYLFCDACAARSRAIYNDLCYTIQHDQIA